MVLHLQLGARVADVRSRCLCTFSLQIRRAAIHGARDARSLPPSTNGFLYVALDRIVVSVYVRRSFCDIPFVRIGDCGPNY